MRILVTGANGFVGTYVVRKLLDEHDVLAVDNLRYGPWRFSRDELARLALNTMDLRIRASLEPLVERFNPQAIIHLAAIHFIPECEQLPDQAVSTNIEATVNLLCACPEDCRFVYASTAAVYAPNDSAHREYEDRIEPMDVYGYTKLSGENFVQYFSALKGFPSAIVRLFNVIGPGETNPHLLPEIIKQLKQGARTIRLGNVHPRRDYIYAQDAADGFIAAATRPFPHSDGNVTIVNLGAGKSYSVKGIVDRLSRVIGEEIVIEVDPRKVRKVDRPNLLADNSRMQAVFSWAPKYEIDEALERIWESPGMLDKLMQ